MYKISLCMLAICLQASDIRISEVMSNPQGSEYENEYIEIYNSSNHVIYINGWILSDGNGVDTLIHFSGPTGLQVHEYALILDPGYDFISGPYLPLIPDSIPIYTISTGSSFGSSGLSNSGESVIIYNPDSSIISQMTWSSASDNGYSWERVSVKHPDSTAVWQQSLTENGTPGFLNSVTKPQHNLSLIDAVVTHTAPGEAVEILLTIRNSGENIVSDFSITSYQDDNQNGIQDTGEWNQSQKYMTPLIPEGDLELSVMLFKLEPGIHHVETWISSEGDGVSSDDTLCFQIKGPYPFDVVSITEIMSSPTSEQGGEWIEIKNLSTKPISLQGWALSDANRTRHLISDSLLFLQPDSFFTFCAKPEVLEYFTLSSDQALALDSWPTLNSASDSVRLFDATDHLIARIFYRGS